MPDLVSNSPGPPPAGGACGRDRIVEINTESLVRPVRRGGQGTDDESAPGGQSGEALPDQVPQPAANSVPDDGVANRLGDDEAGAGWCGCLLRTSVPRRLCRRDLRWGAGRGQMDDDHAAPDALATTDHRGEVSAAPQTLRGGQHDSPRPADQTWRPQAARRARPLLRRVEMMARPARVRMRSRKPWVFARRRLFGWKVRLLTSGSPLSYPWAKIAGVASGPRSSRFQVVSRSGSCHDPNQVMIRNTFAAPPINAARRCGQQASITLAEGERAAAPAYAGAQRASTLPPSGPTPVVPVFPLLPPTVRVRPLLMASGHRCYRARLRCRAVGPNREWLSEARSRPAVVAAGRQDRIGRWIVRKDDPLQCPLVPGEV